MNGPPAARRRSPAPRSDRRAPRPARWWPGSTPCSAAASRRRRPRDPPAARPLRPPLRRAPSRWSGPARAALPAAAPAPAVDELQIAHCVRHRSIDELCLQAVGRDGFRQIVVLGAGYDTRPLRLGDHLPPRALDRGGPPGHRRSARRACAPARACPTPPAASRSTSSATTWRPPCSGPASTPAPRPASCSRASPTTCRAPAWPACSRAAGAAAPDAAGSSSATSARDMARDRPLAVRHPGAPAARGPHHPPRPRRAGPPRPPPAACTCATTTPSPTRSAACCPPGPRRPPPHPGPSPPSTPSRRRPGPPPPCDVELLSRPHSGTAGRRGVCNLAMSSRPRARADPAPHPEPAGFWERLGRAAHHPRRPALRPAPLHPLRRQLRPVGSLGDPLLGGRPPDDQAGRLHQPVVALLAARDRRLPDQAGAHVLAHEPGHARRPHRPAGRTRPAEMALGTAAEWAVRVPFCLLGVMGLYGVYLVTSRLAGRRAGVFAAVVTGTCPIYALVARQAMTDMTFVGPATLALALAALALLDRDERELPRRGRGLWSWPHHPLFYGALGVVPAAHRAPAADRLHRPARAHALGPPPRDHVRRGGHDPLLGRGARRRRAHRRRSRYRRPLYLYIAAVAVRAGRAGQGPRRPGPAGHHLRRLRPVHRAVAHASAGGSCRWPSWCRCWWWRWWPSPGTTPCTSATAPPGGTSCSATTTGTA